jgi:UDP-N-acetylmuramoyl-tripeptide--D-alanyl-D-alanine ligase
MNDILWTSLDLIGATQGEATHSFSATGVSIDTRTLKKGEVYLALKGENLDGHHYVEAAFAAGACAAIVTTDYKTANTSWPLLRVKDTTKALEAMGHAARARATGTIIGVTGSAGKTGTKEMLAVVLSSFGKIHASKKSFNNHWGVPLTLSNLPQDAVYGIFEMGMNHAGEMTNLTDLVKPHIAVITTVEPAHAEHFKTVEAIADAKAEIFSGMDEKGVAVLNIDNPHFQRLKNHARKAGLTSIVTFGEDEEADCRLVDCTLHADSSRVTAKVMGGLVKYKINIPGKHIVMNSLAVLAVVKTVGKDIDQAAIALGNSIPVEGRGNRISIPLEAGQPALIVIDESYNANPASMTAALSVLEMAQPSGEGRRIAVLGDMLELGAEGPHLHAALANPLLKARADLVFCCGPQMDALYSLLPDLWKGAHTADSRALAEQVADAVRPGDIILVKGSAGSKMSYVIEALQQKGKALREKDTKGPIRDAL